MHAARDLSDLRLVYSSWYGDLGGGELRMLDHLRHTQFARERAVVLLNQGGDLQRALARESISSRLVPWKSAGGYWTRQWRWYLAKWQSYAFLRSFRPALVVCNTFPDLETTGRVAAALGLPLVWRARADTFPEAQSWPEKQVRELVAFLNRRVSRILATTAYEPELMYAAGVDRSKIFVVRNGVDLGQYEDEAAGRQLRAELGFSADEFVIACVARMVPQKGYEVVFKAVAELKARGRRVKAILAGDTTLLEEQPEKYKQSLKALASDLGVLEDLTFLGFRKDVWAVMKAADVFVLSSLKEPFGTTVVEAMAASRAVISSDVSGPRESIVEGQTGFFYPAGEAAALAAKVEVLLDNPEARAQMGAAGRTRATELFDLERNIALLDSHCIHVATGGVKNNMQAHRGAAPS